MTPGARVQAAIELLDLVLAAARGQGAAADTLIARYFATRRYAGSKDRRAVRELVYRAIRFAGEVPASGRAALLGIAREDGALAALFDGAGHGPAAIAEGEPAAAGGIAPGWLLARLAASSIDGSEAAALLDRAPLDLRVNRLKAEPAAVAALLAEAEPIDGLPDALRLPNGSDIERSAAGQDGLVEVQDAGSQWVTLAAGAEPGMRVVDLCAGGGGKTLALAAAMANRGAILACDADRGRLSRLAPRAARAGVGVTETRLLDPGREAEGVTDWAGTADLVLIDAPCSGTGTWRRNPEARWRLTPERIDRLVALQRHLLGVGAALVRPGGRLCYVVCSLLDEEGAGQVAGFVGAEPGWSSAAPGVAAGRAHGLGRRLTPAHDATDGFFVATLLRPC